MEEALRWVWLNSDPENTKGVQLDADGTLTIWYNTLDEHGEHEFQRYENIMDWIEETSLKRNGHFKVLYNNDSMYDATDPYNYDPLTPDTWTPGWVSASDKASWETDLTWPTQISLTEAGVLKFLYNNNLLQDIYPVGETFDGTIDRLEGSYSFILPWITKVLLNDNGQFNFIFNNDRLYDASDSDWQADHVTYAPWITWIRRVTLDSNGDVRVTFNNDKVKDNFAPSSWEAASNSYKTQVTWVTRASLDDEGVFRVYFNNDMNQAATVAAGEIWVSDSVNDLHYYEKVIEWVNDIDLDDYGLFTFTWNTGVTDTKQAYWVKNVVTESDGTITFVYCDDDLDDGGTNSHRIDSPFKVKYLTDVSINTGVVEGDGNQKVHLVWNTTDPGTGDPEEEDIGNPLNYIIESTISIPTISYPTVPYWHLLVYYSDPDLRASLSSKWVTYPSVKYPGVVRTEWVDLGSVKGENTGIHVLKNIEDMDELKDAGGNWIPPERLPAADGVTILNPDAAGWSCTLQEPGTDVTVYLFYDYETEEWYRGTSVDPSAVDPSYVITKSAPNAYQEPIVGGADNLKPNGFWFAVETGVAVK